MVDVCDAGLEWDEGGFGRLVAAFPCGGELALDGGVESELADLGFEEELEGTEGHLGWEVKINYDWNLGVLYCLFGFRIDVMNYEYITTVLSSQFVN